MDIFWEDLKNKTICVSSIKNTFPSSPAPPPKKKKKIFLKKTQNNFTSYLWKQYCINLPFSTLP